METVQFVLDYMQQYSTVAHSIDPMLFDINARNNAGATPLELAALEGDCHAAPVYVHSSVFSGCMLHLAGCSVVVCCT